MTGTLIEHGSNMNTFSREAFETCRTLDFFSERELTAQTGHSPGWWPEVIVKELVDNSVDAMEQTEQPPSVEIAIDESTITVTDTGPGIPESTLQATLDYSVRVSTNSKYVSPSRGSQGNALKTVVAIPYVVDGECGRLEIASGGKAYEITVQTDSIEQEPRLNMSNGKPPIVKNGTSVRVHWPDSARLKLSSSEAQFLQLAHGYAFLNPHLTVHADILGEEYFYDATDPRWSKYLPSLPTSPHWYSADDLVELIAACISKDRKTCQERTVRDFISGFAGLSSSRKQKDALEGLGLSRAPLASFADDAGQINLDRVKKLLASMRRHSRPIKPEKLGVIGKEHFQQRFTEIDADLETFKYKLVKGDVDGLPYVIEAAFAYIPDFDERQIFSGVNWSPSFDDVPFDQLDECWETDALLQEQRCGHGEPVVMVIHLTTPKVLWKDRGKSSVSLQGETGEAMISAIQSVTKAWAKQRQAEERDASRRVRREEALRKQQNRKLSLAGAFGEVVKDAYFKSSGGGKYPAGARQIMYACRGQLQEMTGKVFTKGTDQYVTQTLLPKFQTANPELTCDWDVVYDARGHFREPHTGREVPLGTLDVRRYISEFSAFSPAWAEGVSLPGIAYDDLHSIGPLHRFGAVLFVEKEGFLPLFQTMQLQEQYDIAVMSTKGNSVTAARRLADALAGYAMNVLERRLPLYILHDFDNSGFTILGTFTKRTGRRYSFENLLEVIDFGLRLEDVEAMQLDSEEVHFGKRRPKRETLSKNGATDDEIEFILGGHRVELNHMTSPQMVAWLEEKLTEYGVKKVIPDAATLEHAYRNFAARHKLEHIVDEHRLKIQKEYEELSVPAGIRVQIAECLKQNPTLSWTQALDRIVQSKG